LFYDAVVIGASSAGLFVAELLAKSGIQVALFEEVSEISPQARTYIITPGLFRVMPDVGDALVRHQITRIQLQSGSAAAEIELAAPDLIVDRKELLVHLARRAEEAGVIFHTGWKFTGFNKHEMNPRLVFKKGEDIFHVGAGVVIGADGVQSSVKKALTGKWIPALPLLQAEIELPPDWDQRVTKVWFKTEVTPYFFWLIPDQMNKGVVGLIAEKGDDIRTALDSFLEENKLKALEYQSGSAAYHTSIGQLEHKVGEMRVLFVGDAAGQVKVTTVGGTVTGLCGARAAAEAIITGSGYRKKLKPVQRELDLHLFIRNLLIRMSARDYETLVGLITPAVKSFLRGHDRDSMRSHFWKLVVLQPGFIPLGLKLLSRYIWDQIAGKST